MKNLQKEKDLSEGFSHGWRLALEIMVNITYQNGLELLIHTF